MKRRYLEYRKKNTEKRIPKVQKVEEEIPKVENIESTNIE